MKKIISSTLCFVFLLCLSAFLPINFNNITLAETSQTDVVNDLINEYYLSDLDNVKDRTAGGDGEKNMANKLQNFLSTNGFEYSENLTSFQQSFELTNDKTSQNVIGVKNNNAGKYVILGAHYDSVFKKDKSYGYSDNLSGVIAVMHTANLLANSSLNFDVVVAFWGAEEVGFMGSNYFVKNLSDEFKKNILLYVNFDSVGVGDYLYYYTNDFASKYKTNVENYFSKTTIKKYQNQIFSTKPMLGINYTSLPLQSDNLSFLTNGINSLSFFAGNLNTSNGYGFFETAGYPKIMHSTDTKETVDSIFEENRFAENINKISTETANFLTSSTSFVIADFEGNQVQTWAYNVWNLKFFGVIFIGVGFVIFLVIYFIRHKKEPQKPQGTYYNKNSKKKQKKLKINQK